MVNLVGPTTADIRDVMVQGGGAGSAIMEICGKDETPVYEKSKRRLVWRNGAQSLLFSAEEPERLRGPQHMKVWCDELAAWKYADQAWEQMEFGLRLGPKSAGCNHDNAEAHKADQSPCRQPPELRHPGLNLRQ